MESPATAQPVDTKRKIGLYTAIAIVVANMIGTGVFTSIGYQASGTPRPLPILALWVLGGVLAICGAFAYGELGSAFPRSGGEYNYLSKLYHPKVGFLSGWVSATVGFPAPIALAAIAFGQYFLGSIGDLNTPAEFQESLQRLLTVLHIPSGVSSACLPYLLLICKPKIFATLLIGGITLIHLASLRFGGRFQTFITYFEVLLMLLFVACGFFITPHPVSFSLIPTGADLRLLFCPAFAVSLVYVSYAYSGWNGSTYLASEIKNPSVNVPKSILGGTLVVLILYFFLNYVFLRSTPIAALAGNLDVGKISAVNIFGGIGGKIMSIFISFCLISSVSSMVLSGPRILKVMGEDHHIFNFFARANARGIPWRSIVAQSCIALVYIWTGTFEQVLTFTGFTLTLFTSITVLGVFILRRRNGVQPYAYKTTGFPVTPVLFLALNLWMVVFLLWKRPIASLAGLAIVGLGFIVYLLSNSSPMKGPQQ